MKHEELNKLMKNNLDEESTSHQKEMISFVLNALNVKEHNSFIIENFSTKLKAYCFIDNILSLASEYLGVEIFNIDECFESGLFHNINFLEFISKKGEQQ